MSSFRFAVFKEDVAALDKLLAGCVVLLVAWGTLCIFSAGSSAAGRGESYAVRQIGWGIVACGAYFTVVAVGYHRLMDFAYPLYGLVLILLCLTPWLAPEVKGAQRMLSLGFIRFQPSEFGKTALILVLAKFLARYPPFTLKTFLMGLGVGLPALFMVFRQPDAGSSLVYAVIIFAALFVAGTPLRYLGTFLGGGIAMLPFAWFLLKDYQKMRLLIFLDPMLDPLGAGYNVIQSRIAVGSGGVLGKGFLQGLQSKLRFLPEPHTDFIFSVHAEEFGFWGGLIVLILFGIVFTRIVMAGVKSRDIRGKFLVAGVAAWIWFQMFEGIGMSMGIMPVTGIPLPFLSYGGSALVSLALGLGLVGSVYASSAKPYKLD
jgi:rod shape determining protein RodA